MIDQTVVKPVERMLGPDAKLTTTELASELMGIADDYAVQTAQACAELAKDATDPEVRNWALKTRLGTATAVFTIVTCPNPAVALLDMVVYLTLKRIVLEEDIIPALLKDKGAPLLEIDRHGEQRAWEVAAKVLTAEQQDELKELIRRWRADHPQQRYLSHIRFAEFNRYRLNAPTEARQRPWSIFKLLYIDPLAGADPVAQELHETRLLAERLFYFASRFVNVVRWQVEALYEDLFINPHTKTVMSEVSKFVAAAEKIAEAAASLPREREAILQALETQQKPLRELLADVRETLARGEQMAAAVDAGTRTLDSFVGRFDKEDGPREAPAPSSSTRPFDVREYGAAAAEIRDAAQELRQAIDELETLISMPPNSSGTALPQLLQAVEASSTNLVRRAALYACAVVGLLLLGLPLALLTYRYGARKLAVRAGRSSAPERLD